MRFDATLELHGRTATGIEVPAEVMMSLGSAKNPAVVVTLNGFVYRTTVGVMGGKSLLPVSAEIRRGAGVSAGDRVMVEVELDTEPRTVEVPADLAAALASEPELAGAFGGLSYSNQRQHVLAVEGAKTEATRQRRVEAVLAKLRG
ncbi:YdeI/OmpD-associated family protein [Nakamurella deserti]|uniref:YdeI/OmpD-associated family protein n=1 Tax=Nakamurella deserti TaxID=2164074 RepID=UPI000DBEA117|nr:YdeI/OmpD-associated family protein [Nakamurella deserti]